MALGISRQSSSRKNPRGRLNRFEAAEILSQAGIPVGAEYYALDRSKVDALLDAAKKLGYRKSPSAPGSTSRMFHEYLQRTASRKENPDEAAAAEADAIFEEFHGAPSDEHIHIEFDQTFPDEMATLGVLVRLLVITVQQADKNLDRAIPIDFEVGLDGDADGDADGDGDGEAGNPRRARRRNHPDLTDRVFLCTPDRRQLYFMGGDQKLDLEALGLGEGTPYFRESMTIGYVAEVTYRTRKKFDDFRTIDYFHRHGKEGHKRKLSELPVLVYDTRNHLLSVSGGIYDTLPEGIVD